jgi:glutathione S-transferase
MKLWYHPNSPYARKVYTFAIELGLQDQLDLAKVVVCPVPHEGWSTNNEDVATANPMAKIPSLVTDDMPEGVFDSRVICDYLETLPGARKPHRAGDIQLKVLHALSDGMGDAEVLCVYEDALRTPLGLRYEEWYKGQRVKLMRGFDRLEKEATNGCLIVLEPDDVAPSGFCAFGSLVFMLDARSVQWREGRPNLTKWYEAWQQRASYKTTCRGDIDW